MEDSGPVDVEFVVGFEGVDEIMRIVFQEVFFSVVIYKEGESSFSCVVAPYEGGVFHWGVVIWCHVFNKVSEGKDVRFFEAVHSFAYHHVDVYIVFDDEVVLIHNLLRDN